MEDNHGRQLPEGAAIFCGDEGLRRLLEIELGVCGILLSPEPSQAAFWLVDLDDSEAVLSSRPDGSKLLCWSRCEEETFPQITSAEAESYFLRRPFSLTELESCLQRLADRGENDGNRYAILWPSVSQRGKDAPAPTCILSPVGQGGVSVGGAQITLTPREWALFDCLWQSKGALVPKEVLRDVLCATTENGLPTANTLEVYICHLRKKLEQPVSRRLITTVRGQGYRLESD